MLRLQQLHCEHENEHFSYRRNINNIQLCRALTASQIKCTSLDRPLDCAYIISTLSSLPVLHGVLIIL